MVQGFFASDKNERQAANTLLEALSRHAHLYIFGGMIRDIGLSGKKDDFSDIDLVFSGTREELVNALKYVGIDSFLENKFGGYRLKHFQVEYDIWSLEDTWAFREKLISLDTIHSLLHTPLMTWDAVIYDVKEKRLITPPNYLQDLINRRLDLVLEQNPNEKGSIIRILRTIYAKDVITLGSKLCDYLRCNLNRYNREELLDYELLHFGSNIMNHTRIEKLVNTLQECQEGEDIIINHYKRKQNLRPHYHAE
ncbi:hypothetical protein [Dryocola clanedunensis]